MVCSPRLGRFGQPPSEIISGLFPAITIDNSPRGLPKGSVGGIGVVDRGDGLVISTIGSLGLSDNFAVNGGGKRREISGSCINVFFLNEEDSSLNWSFLFSFAST